MPLSDALAITYYVDSATASSTNNGQSEAAPFKTLTQVNAITFQPGDVVRFKRGGMWAGTLAPKGNGNSSQRLVFTDYVSATSPSTLLPIINGPGTSGSCAVLLENKSFFTFENFNITNTGANNEGLRRGIEVRYSGGSSNSSTPTIYDGLTIQLNQITKVAGYTARPPNGATYVWNYATGAIYLHYTQNLHQQVRNLQILGNDIFENKCIGIQLKPGSFMSETNAATRWISNLLIKDNTFMKTGGDHILVQGALAPRIENNAGYGAGEIAVQGANLWIAGMWVGYSTRDSLFQYNEVAHTVTQDDAGAGDSCAFDVDYGTTGSHTFQYNYTHNNAGGILLMMGRAPIAGTDPQQYHPPAAKQIIYRYNISVNDDRRGSAGKQFPLNTSWPTNSAHIYNNVIYNVLPAGFRTSNTGGEFFTNNIFYANWASYGPVPRFSHNAYYGHIPRVNDPYKVVADPKLTGPLPGSAPSANAYATVDSIRTPNNIFKLLPGSPLINAGKTISANGGIDFWGNPLYATTHADIGAHEVVNGAGNNQPAAMTIIDAVATSPALSFTSPPGSTTPWNFITNDDEYDNSTVAWTQPNLGNAMLCTFTGTNISIFGLRSASSGRFRVEVNGNTANPITVDCYWPEKRQRQELLTITGLPAGQNTIRVVPIAKSNLSGWDGVYIDYFQIAPGSPSAPAKATVVDMASGTTGLNLPVGGSWSFATGVAETYAQTLLTSSAVNGAPFTYTFTGTGIRIYGPKYKSRGNLAVTLNGNTQTVSCFSPGEKQEIAALLYEVKGLAHGTYTLSAQVVAKTPHSEGSVVSIDCVEVMTGGAVAQAPVIIEPVAAASLPTGQPWTLAYSGTAWTHSTDATFHGSNKSVSLTAGSAMQLTFPGTRARLYVKVAPNLGLLNITLNGVSVGQVNTGSATTTVPYLIYETPVLPYAPNHTLKATIAGSGLNVGIDYFEYQP